MIPYGFDYRLLGDRSTEQLVRQALHEAVVCLLCERADATERLEDTPNPLKPHIQLQVVGRTASRLSWLNSPARAAARSRKVCWSSVSGANDPLLVGTQRECKAARVVEHQDVIVVTPRRTGVEAKIGLIEAAGALLITDRDR